MQSPNYSPKSSKKEVSLPSRATFQSHLLTPPNSQPQPNLSPNNYNYYSPYLNKTQFNSILINCSLNLLKIVFNDHAFNSNSIKLFIIEILKRSKTSIQTLQVLNYYIFKIIKKGINVDLDVKKLFLGLLIIASKFNQDCNYSFRNWCLICGLKEDGNKKKLTEIEFKCLNYLDYECYINGKKYDEWCKFLIIFGYDFIKSQKIIKNNEEITNVEIDWDTDITDKLSKWESFFKVFTFDHFEFLDINFETYFNAQLDKKIFIQQGQQSKKRQFVIDTVPIKKIKV
ncbi:unnamed protein product [Candida verbasci]|uniref:Cyclin N-terminal domain-containing protein n=1 Tax=Candida verbasci TaxID=1227364 RepID=A0A9W4U089_9ASCO|nr:unnamed protein product [Candida verbasci]